MTTPRTRTKPPVHSTPPVLPEPLAKHILPTAAGMVGVCLTAVGLVKVVEHTHGAASTVDEYLALNAVLFSASMMMSYLSLKHGIKGRRIGILYEKWADILFVTGIVVMNGITLLFAYELI